MITFTQETTRYTVKPENAQVLRALAAKPPKHKIKVDPKHSVMCRDFPTFYAGMTTDDYLSQYAGLNSRLLLTPLKFSYADRAAPMLDATTPEVLEELDPDWTPPAPKVKKLTAAQLLKDAETDRDLYLETLEEIYKGLKSGTMTSNQAMMLAARVLP
jgi:hypothetical protein